jgi:DNA-binding GntR family transcriptional regulator
MESNTPKSGVPRELNAEAMDVSDRWVAAGCDPRDPPPAEEWASLIRSFAAVVEAVHRPPADPTVTASLSSGSRHLDALKATGLRSDHGWKDRRPSRSLRDACMSVLPIRPVTTASSLAECLRDELLSGEYAPGTPLGDADVVERAGVSAATARAALSELEHDGLVVHSLHHGVEVVRITPDDVRDIYVARRVYEVAGLEVLLRRRPIDVSWLEAAIERMGEAAVCGSARALVEAELAFHLAIVAAAGSRRLTRAAQGALMELRLVLSVADRARDDLPALVADHQYLVEVFRSGHLREAVSALEDHLSRGEVMARQAAAEPA